MKRKAHIILLVLLLLCVLSTTAFAIDESEVESAIAASSKEEGAGNVFIWFLFGSSSLARNENALQKPKSSSTKIIARWCQVTKSR